MHQKCVLNSFRRMNSCNEHDELKFNPEIVKMEPERARKLCRRWRTVRTIT